MKLSFEVKVEGNLTQGEQLEVRNHFEQGIAQLGIDWWREKHLARFETTNDRDRENLYFSYPHITKVGCDDLVVAPGEVVTHL